LADTEIIENKIGKAAQEAGHHKQDFISPEALYTTIGANSSVREFLGIDYCKSLTPYMCNCF
jgi:hypothetical protein